MFPVAGLGHLGRPVMPFLGSLGQDNVVAQQESFWPPSTTAASDKVVAQMMQTASIAQTPDSTVAQQDPRTIVGRTTCVCGACPPAKKWPWFLFGIGGVAAGIGIGFAAFGSRSR